jgi:DNA (cytosine-5)-methyltransferase 1
VSVGIQRSNLQLSDRSRIVLLLNRLEQMPVEHPLSIRALAEFDARFPMDSKVPKSISGGLSEVNRKPRFFEFFAGGGMARAGLGDGWECAFANDFDDMKARTYAMNWGDDVFVPGDVGLVTTKQLPGRADLTWASFPCQDLSLAGKYQGLGEASSEVMTRSGTFWPFWNLMTELRKEGRAPRLIVLENVVGAITSRNGRDFGAICNALSGGGYRYGAVVMDARHFVPQSRPRLFFIAVADDVPLPTALLRRAPDDLWHSAALRTAQSRLIGNSKAQWVWWSMAAPPARNIGFVDIIEEKPTHCRWHSKTETERLLAMMTPLHLAKIQQARADGKRRVGGVYKRTRLDENGVKRQRAEIRFDDIAGCLRTPAGGSSRQAIVVVEGNSIRSRLLSPREAARLMGLDDTYILPDRYNDAYHVAGDGVCVPVVRYIASQIVEPILGLAVEVRTAA